MSAELAAGALRELDRGLVDAADRVEDLLAYHRNQVTCPIYTSVDIRRNRHKAAVVDANAFPAGFNNLHADSSGEAASVIENYMAKTYPGAEDLLILGENHTRNKWYFQNLKALQDLFVGAGHNVTLGTMNEELFPSADVETAQGDTIRLHGVLREGDALIADGIVHDVVILNNDLSAGAPDLLDGLDQPVTPPPAMGWHRRRKSMHFGIVAELARQLGGHAGIDPWLMSADFRRVDGVDFGTKAGLDDVGDAVDSILAATRAKYEEYGIEREPNVFVKADAGTYGMGVMAASSGDELREMNRKKRDSMARGKEGTTTSSVIVQEGVMTDLARDGGGAAEPVLYMVCGRVIGGFHRVHEGRSSDQSLNAPGSHFEPFTLHDERGVAGKGTGDIDPISQHVFQVLGEVASIATGYECRMLSDPDLQIASYP